MSELPRGIALVAGVNDYSGKIRPLRSAVADAQALAGVLGDAHGYEVTLLADEEASGQAITAALRAQSQRANDEERPFLLYFAGHGVARGDGDDGPQGFLLPHDADASEPSTWIPMTVVRAALDDIPSRHLLVVLDCCFAGAFRWSATRDSEWDIDPLYDSQYERYLKGIAWQVLTSASHDEKAMDVVPGRDNTRDGRLENGHSPFAAALLRGLAGDADTSRPGVQPDGVITATELYQYTFDVLVPAGEDSHQTPGIWPLRNDNTGQFVFRNPRQPLNTRKDLPLTDENNPWLGLAAYSEDDAPLFFGRERWVGELLSKVRDETGPTLIAVVGASGTGKSSVVKAGVLPRLNLPRDDANGEPHSEEPVATEWTIVRSPRLSATPSVELRAVREQLAAASNRSLLLIDQFEELYTQCRDDDERDRYLAALRELMDAGEAHKVIVTLRSDFEPRPRKHPALADLWEAGRCLVPAFTSAELRECIEGPAHARALYFDPPALIDALVDEVMAMPGALPMLSFALAEMYRQAQQRRRRSGALDRALTQADYDQTGGVVGSLHRRATELFEAHAEPEQKTIRRVFLRLLAQDGARLSRRRVERAELRFAKPTSPEQQRVDRVIDEYVQARLLVASDGTLEPAHDTLVSAWDRLQEWLSDAGPQNLIRALWRAASDWQRSQRDAGVTWHDDPRLPQALSVQGELNVLEREFVVSSETVRKARTRRLLVGGIAVFATVAAIAVVALIQWRAAVRQRSIAETQLAEARYASGRALLGQARLALTGKDYFAAAMLAGEAVGFGGFGAAAPNGEGTAPLVLIDDSKPEYMDVVDVLTRANMHSFRPLAWMPLGLAVYARSSPFFAGVDADGTIEVWDLRQGAVTRLQTPDGAGARIIATAISDDGAYVGALVALEQGAGNADSVTRAVVWHLADFSRPSGPQTLTAPSGRYDAGLLFDDGAERLALFGRSGVVIWRRPASANTLGDTPSVKPFSGLQSLAFTPDGVILGGGDYRIVSADLAPRCLVAGARSGDCDQWVGPNVQSNHKPGEGTRDVNALARGPGALLAAAIANELYILGPGSAETAAQPVFTTVRDIDAIAFAPNGKSLAVASEGTVTVLGVPGAQRVAQFAAASSLLTRVTTLGFRADGSELVIGDNARMEIRDVRFLHDFGFELSEPVYDELVESIADDASALRDQIERGFNFPTVVARFYGAPLADTGADTGNERSRASLPDDMQIETAAQAPPGRLVALGAGAYDMDRYREHRSGERPGQVVVYDGPTSRAVYSFELGESGPLLTGLEFSADQTHLLVRTDMMSGMFANGYRWPVMQPDLLSFRTSEPCRVFAGPLACDDPGPADRNPDASRAAP